MGDITPGDINSLASDITSFCTFIDELDDIDEIKKLAVAIKDNWKRYCDSA